MPFCDNSGDLIQLQTKSTKFQIEKYHIERRQILIRFIDGSSFPYETAVYLKGACLYLLSKWQYDSGGGLCDPYVSLCDAGLFVSV